MSLRRSAREVLETIPLLDAVFRRVVWSRIHFPEAEMAFLAKLEGRPLDVSIDVGAALGAYSWIMNRKSRTVLAFEPGEKHADFIARALWGTNIRLARKAVGEHSGTAAMYTPGNTTDALHSATLHAGNPVIDSPDTAVRTVSIIALDDYLDDVLAPGRRVDLIKIDVEGYELAVLQGATKTLHAHHPMIICEIESRHNENYRAVFEMLYDLGYRSGYWSGGQFLEQKLSDITSLQNEQDLSYRLSEQYSPEKNQYINNFTFFHERSTLRVFQ